MNVSRSKSITLSFCLLLVAVAASGCLTVDRKEIIFKVNPDGSGTGRFIFHALVSIDEEGRDASLTDYTELVNRYLKGRKFEDYYPQYTNFRKRLFEENGQLSAEISFDFVHYDDVGLYRYQDRGPWMYHVGVKSEFAAERYDTSNGTYGGDLMPVVFWADSVREFHIRSRFDRSDMAGRTLLPLYRRIGTD